LTGKRINPQGSDKKTCVERSRVAFAGGRSKVQKKTYERRTPKAGEE